MIPVLLISSDPVAVKSYLSDFITDNKLRPEDIYLIKKDGQNLKIDQIRQLDEIIYRQRKNRQLVIIYDFESTKKEAQNSLLKKLEDDSAKTDFILISQSEYAIIPTIISRVKVIKLVDKSVEKLSPVDINLLVDRQLSIAQKLNTYSRLTKEQANDIVNELIKYFRDEIATPRRDVGARNDNRAKVSTILKELIKVRHLIISNNINPEAAVDYLVIYIEKG